MQSTNSIVSTPQYVVMNLAAGPGEGIDLDAAQHRALLGAQGIPVLGYVRVERGLRTFADVSSDALLWRNVYDVDGIFWDEAPNAMAYIELLRALRTFACRLRNGGGHCLFNPGASVTDSVLGLLPDTTWLTPEDVPATPGVGPVARVTRWSHAGHRWVVLRRVGTRLDTESADDLASLVPRLAATPALSGLIDAYEVVAIRPAASLVHD